MIQIDAIHIEEFRGIRKLDLRLDGKSFVIWGPNGAGKSGVVDAIDFGLTGSISRLSGTGTGGLSVLKHGPHIYRYDTPEAAKVVLSIRDTVTGKRGELTRTVNNAGSFTLTPDAPGLRSAIDRMSEHPELTLSRREIIRYVLAEPAQRAQDVQALLKLDRIGQIRKLLVSVRTKSSTALTAAEGRLINAEVELRRHLDLDSVLPAEVSQVVNGRRAVLGLEPLETVTIDTDLRAGAGETDGPAFNKASALRDIDALVTSIAGPDALNAAVEQLTAALRELATDPGILQALQHRRLVQAGLDLVATSACPLCDLQWDSIETLKIYLHAKLERSESAASIQGRILSAAASVQAELRAFIGLIRAVQPLAASDSNAEFPPVLQKWINDLAAVVTSLDTIDGAAVLQERLATSIVAAPAEITGGMKALRSAVDAKPDQTSTAEAQAFLAIAQERWAKVRSAQRERSKAATAASTAQLAHDTYCAVADETLAMLYKSVEDNFSSYYSQINADDESSFRAELRPSGSKLGLSVDFYHIGSFPPGAYHSEGHQDGMGVCLYLALVRQLLGQDFRFAVLDDVVMSVDRNHRRRFCELLRDTFPDVQFIITTHDEVWARQMRSSGLISSGSQARFHGWTVDGGPIYEQDDDVWNRITADLDNDDTPGAAHKLRRYLEAATADIAESIGAQVPYRPELSWDLGELLSAVKGRHKELLKKAAAAANSWNSADAQQRIRDLQEQRAKIIPVQEDESWVINKLVHNNDWVFMGAADFTPVIDATRNFLALFTCGNPDCSSWIHLAGRPGHEEYLRCHCGAYSLNLQNKSR